MIDLNILGNVVISGLLTMIWLALIAGCRINHPAMILAIFIAVIFSILFLFTDFLNTLGAIL